MEAVQPATPTEHTPPEPPISKRNPFPGLRPFEAADADLFFGREAHVDQLLARLAQRRFVAVVGPSGCGKSSLTRAGLIPALRDGFLKGTGHKWCMPIMRPGGDPEGALRDALLAELPASTDSSTDASAPDAFNAGRFYVEGALDGSRDALSRAGAQLSLQAGGANVLLLVDQFEELFRFNRRAGDEAEWYERSNRFVQQLIEAASDPAVGPRGHVYVVLTMRDEFVGRCAAFSGLAELMNAGMYLVPRLTRAQLADAVQYPLAGSGRKLADGLLDTVVNDSIAVQDELPVLQHAMMRTWSRLGENDRQITPQRYDVVGGLGKALNVHGNELIGLDPEGNPDPDKRTLTHWQLRLCEAVFKRLTLDSGNESTRAPASLKTLARVVGVEPNDKDLLHVLDLFRAPDCQFLSPGIDPQLSNSAAELKPSTEIDLTHEAILRTWKVLGKWAVEERQQAIQYRLILEAARRYGRGAVSGSLYRDPQLSAEVKWWNERALTQAWAERYHPAVADLTAQEKEDFTFGEGEQRTLNHDALFRVAQRFLDEGVKQRDLEEAAAKLERENGAKLERARLRQRLIIRILAPALAAVGIGGLLAIYAEGSRANAETLKRAAAEAQIAASDREAAASRQSAAASEATRIAAEAKAAASDVEAKAREAEAESLKKELKALDDRDAAFKVAKLETQRALDAYKNLNREFQKANAQLLGGQACTARVAELSKKLCGLGDQSACVSPLP